MGPSRRRRRVLFAVAAVVVLVAVGAAVGWYVWLPHHRPGLRAGERYGVDVSNHQGVIDWSRVANDDMWFAYIKATEGSDYVDAFFARNWTGAQGAGLRHGAYHFFTFCSTGDVQARNFLATIGDQTDALPPAVDLEIRGNCGQRPSAADVYRELNNFLSDVEAATHKSTVLYVGDDFEAQYPVARSYGRPLWVRDLLRRPDGDWTIWQTQGRARVDGISGDVDLNVARPSLT